MRGSSRNFGNVESGMAALHLNAGQWAMMLLVPVVSTLSVRYVFQHALQNQWSHPNANESSGHRTLSKQIGHVIILLLSGVLGFLRRVAKPWSSSTFFPDSRNVVVSFSSFHLNALNISRQTDSDKLVIPAIFATVEFIISLILFLSTTSTSATEPRRLTCFDSPVASSTSSPHPSSPHSSSSSPLPIGAKLSTLSDVPNMAHRH
mmetsp:Transcript_17747/g.31800  ORF Transcript_17747/g.31800 Transcript_17747/m.31800 type:complete len:205 (+) Transcript_17747:1120-1734(+)